MFKRMQSTDQRLRTTSHQAGVAVIEVPLNAIKALALLLVLLIIPTSNGVALIA